MTDPRKQRFGPYIRSVADNMELRDWSFQVRDTEPTAPNSLAQVDCTFGRKLAVVSLSDNFLDLSKEDQRQTIVHELTHCLLEPAMSTLRQMIDDDQFQILLPGIEYSVDAIADAIAPRMNLPEFIENA
jgi:hypothetical protein